MSGILLALGVYILIRFTGWGTPRASSASPSASASWPRSASSRDSSTPPVVAAGVPVATPALLASGRMEPRKVVGSVDTSEFVVSVAASIGFLIGLGAEGIPLSAVAALLIGGLIAAPIAAWLVRHIPGRILGSLVGGVIILTNVRTILRSDQVDASDARRR